MQTVDAFCEFCHTSTANADNRRVNARNVSKSALNEKHYAVQIPNTIIIYSAAIYNLSRDADILGGVVVRTLDLRPSRRGFESRS